MLVMKLISLFLFIITFTLNCFPKSENDLSKFFPEDLKTIIKNPKNFNTKPDKIKNNNFYYIRDGHKYALAIERNNQEIKKIHYTCTKTSACKDISFFEAEFASNMFKLSTNEKGKYSGRYIELNIPDKGITFRFKNNSRKNLREIIINNPKGDK